jgi:hypothetical protein
MYWYGVIIAFVMTGVPLSIERDDRLRQRAKILYFPLVLFVLVIFVGLRSSSPDLENYKVWFETVSASQLVIADWIKDPAYVLVSSVVSWTGLGFIAVVLFFAIAALASQFYFSKIASDQRLITLLFFLIVCRTFVGSDMTSIRSAVAIPLMSSSILLAFRGKKRNALMLYVVSLAFHLSVVVAVLPFVLAMLNVRFNSRWWIVSIVAAAFLAESSLQRIMDLLSSGDRTAVYVTIGGQPPPMAYLVYIATRVLLLGLILIFFWDRVAPESRLVLFCYSIGISVQIVFVFNNALSWRASDVFGLFDMCVLLIPFRYLAAKTRIAYTVALVVLGLAFFCSALPVLDPYRWVLA